jgi:hypothetical protein
MIESPLLDELKAEWTREASLETMIGNLMTVLVTRFGPNAEALENQLKAIGDEARLKDLVKHAVTARTLTSFRKQLTPWTIPGEPAWSAHAADPSISAGHTGAARHSRHDPRKAHQHPDGPRSENSSVTRTSIASPCLAPGRE